MLQLFGAGTLGAGDSLVLVILGRGHWVRPQCTKEVCFFQVPASSVEASVSLQETFFVNLQETFFALCD